MTKEQVERVFDAISDCGNKWCMKKQAELNALETGLLTGELHPGDFYAKFALFAHGVLEFLDEQERECPRDNDLDRSTA